MTEEEKAVNRARKKAYIAWIIAKLEDYLLDNDEEDACCCFLWFKRGSEEQIKIRPWKRIGYTGHAVGETAEDRLYHMLEISKTYREKKI